MRNFLKQDDGVVAVVYAMMLASLISVIGLVVDVNNYTGIKSKINAISDSALLAAVGEVTRFEKENLADPEKNANPENVREEAMIKAIALARKHFNKRTEDLIETSVEEPEITLVKTGGVWHGSLTYRATYRPYFGSFVGVPSLKMSDTSGAIVSTGDDDGEKIVRFYLLLDASSSMGIGANDIDMQNLVNDIGCVFVCHVLGESNFEYASPSIQTRFDVLKTSIQDLVQKIADLPEKDGTFYISVLTFDEEILQEISLSKDYDAIKREIDNFTLPTHRSSTRVDLAIKALAGRITRDSKGDKRARNIVILATDGLNSTFGDAEKSLLEPPGQYTYKGMYPLNMWFSEERTYVSTGATSPVYPEQCEPLKDINASVAVLHTTYRVRTDYPYEKRDLLESFYINVMTMGSSLSDSLQSCASNGSLYREVSQGDELFENLEEIFEKSQEAISLRLQ